MTTNTTTVTFTPAAAAMVKEEVSSFKRDNRRHANYVAEMADTATPVTAETVAAHVAAFRDAYKAANKNASGDDVKAFATKVRNGLNRVIGKQAEKSEPTALVTALGAKSTRAEVIAAWEAAQD